jgi:hypothetical protein
MQNPIQIKQVNLDLERLKRDARRINTKICKQLGHLEIPADTAYQSTLKDQLDSAPISSRLHDYYNVFSFPYDGIQELYVELCKIFKEVCEYDQPYYVHAWLNYLQKGDSVPWHNHWGALSGLRQTYVCSAYINAEPSNTIYKFPEETYTVKNQNNTITIYEDIGDIHMVEPWTKDEPRITISMDIVPMKYIQGSPFILNTWMPII